MARKKVGSMQRGLGSLLLGGMLCLPLTPLFAGSTASRGPSGCPEGVSPAEYVCFTLEEEAARQIKINKIESALAVARAQRPRRFGKFWSSVGASYDPVAKTTSPFGYGGITFGRAYVYGGFFGSEPSVGFGFTF